LYSGFALPVALKSETSEEIAKILENHLIKSFGPPKEISSDNAANLQGPEIKKLCKFYNISYRTTVPYSPTSHALVEISNRYITQLLRIFSDQFQANWPNVLTLAALVYNSVPRVQLSNHSPFYIMYQKEPFAENDFSNVNAKNLDLPEFLKDSINNRIYAKILRERLLLIRAKNNKMRNSTYKSYPKGTLILVRDLRPKVHKKLKPLYYKAPQKIITEYKCTVYAMDFLGKVRKHSKNNIKIASERSNFLFSSLPDDIKIVLGDEFNEELWNKIKDSGTLPAYLSELEIEEEMQRVLRSKEPIATDSHLLETAPPTAPDADNEKDNLVDEEEDNLEELLNDKVVEQLNELHSKGQLLDPKMTLSDIPVMAEKLENPDSPLLNDVDAISDLELPEDPEPIASPVPQIVKDPAAVDPSNILPENSKRSRRVRFNLP
jgi:hypothetical protein